MGKEAAEAVAFGFAEDRKYTAVAVVAKLRQTPICSIILRIKCRLMHIYSLHQLWGLRKPFIISHARSKSALLRTSTEWLA